MGIGKKNRTPLAERPSMGEEKPDEELMGKRKPSPRLSTASVKCRYFKHAQCRGCYTFPSGNLSSGLQDHPLYPCMDFIFQAGRNVIRYRHKVAGDRISSYRENGEIISESHIWKRQGKAAQGSPWYGDETHYG